MEINTNNYPTHKTISLVDENSSANKVVEKPVIEPAQRVEMPPVIKPVVDNKHIVTSPYPAHKTIVISTEVVETIKDEFKKELESVKNVIPVAEIKADVNLVLPKNEDVTVNQIQKVVTQSIPTANYPAHKTVSLASTLVTEQKVEVKVSEPLISKPDVKVDITSVLPQNQGIVANQIQKNITQTVQTANYPAHKTVSLTSAVATEQKVEAKAPESIVTKLVTTEEIKQTIAKPVEPILNTPTDNNLKNTYPAHKTFSFVTGETNTAEAKTVVNPVQTTTTAVENKTQPVTQVAKKEAVVSKENAPVVKAKKPLVWVIASATILVTSAAAIWYTNQQKNKLQEEVVALKQSNAELFENVQKFQKDIRIDDIIARAGTLDAKNNIAVEMDATKSEVIRTCFSVMPNAAAKGGKKTVYIRLLDGAGNVVTANKDNTFEYRGAKIEYSEKKEIDFKGSDLMLCVDYKSTQKLEKGSYKAELYNDGVLDGTTTFELK